MPQKPPPPTEPSGDVVQVSGPVSRVKVGLRVVGGDLTPDDVTALLGHTPTRSWRKGDVQPDSRYHVLRKTGAWFLDSEEPEDGPLQAHIESVLASVTDDLRVWRDLVNRYRVDLNCGLFLRRWNEGLELSPSVLASISERGITFGLDIYGS